MELNAITMERPKARQAFLEYRKAVNERHMAEDEQIMRGYKELAKGHQLISLIQALRAGGTVERRHPRIQERKIAIPRLGICRADSRWCWTGGIDEQGKVQFQGKADIAESNRKDRVRVPDGTFEPSSGSSWSWSQAFRAMVPIVPPPLRPVHHLRNYHVLWEADWQPVPEPPGDPALLKHIGGDLYAVLAIWDLTEIERAVLAGRTVD